MLNTEITEPLRLEKPSTAFLSGYLSSLAQNMNFPLPLCHVSTLGEPQRTSLGMNPWG